MLEWDPKKRGRCKNSTAFSILEKTLDKKVVLVFCVDTFRMLSFEIDKTLSLEDFEKMLEVESGIPVTSQEILLPKGHVPNPDVGAHQFISNLEEEEFIVFLFDKRDMPVTTTSNIIIPPIVENMMRNPRTEMKYQEQRTSWAQAVYLSHQENTLANRLIHAFKANLMHLLTKTSYTHKNTSRMTAEMNKLLSKCSFFQKSLEQDIQNYEK
ncbi:Inhibitor of nuclear factor kappa-B kinase subunit alpha, partial [Stegodyphus mimosarum]